MAISIIKGFTATDLFNGSPVTTSYLSAHNSTIIKWTTDSGKTISSGEIWFNGALKFTELIPIGSLCEFDCMEVVKSLFGLFDDTMDYQVSDVVKYDANLFKQHSIRLKLNFTDTTSEYVDVYGKFLRSVRQHIDLSNGMYYFTPDGTPEKFANVLLNAPRKKEYFAQQIKIFKGYPMDISFIAPTANNYLQFVLYNQTQSLAGNGTYTITTPSGARTNKEVQRFILSDGYALCDILSTYPAITKGYLQIDHRVSDVGALTNLFSFGFEIVDECGVYVKWMNRQGAWSYWLFNKNSRNIINSKTRGTALHNAGLLSYSADEFNLGFDVDEKIQLATQNIERWELDHILDLASSPCIYMYMKPKGTLAYQNGNSDVWLKITDVSNFKYVIKKETNKFSIGFELNLPKIYTQTL